ncbi:VOC family protein [Candidatus Peregrinibacteria bacterium]|jgi:uncharacterized protein|nr:VOC family protein [Candidatus Peregrinibacteria bacterium]MBT4631708.1 VOC family protein [Candidatus Peregrinibacteria bacterium]
MKSKISLLTLGTEDIKRAAVFYKALGFVVHGEEDEDHVMFKAEGTWLALYSKNLYEKEMGIAPTGEFSGVVMAHNVGSKEGVDEVMEEARAAGGKIVKEAYETYWGGYAGYFQDPDGHVWSAAWNPFTDLT